ncbi:hypothetical protein CWE09_01950 [Aliidiomarina minuta]|uniref:Uncharacterized protein n=1 Tax=Aliidiomarina minuta TaxID=880057 RepID=A0A432WA88_9GAMM|nr:hypothetical protein CWE09_01950 [Aliidiomarina minuta]
MIRLAIWTVSWVAAIALARFGPDYIWGSNQLLTVGAILLNLGIGLGLIVANIQHLKTLDEMMQKIQLEAMGISLGIGVIGGIGYALLNASNIISIDAEIAHLVILIAVSYLVAIFVGYRRYQ